MTKRLKVAWLSYKDRVMPKAAGPVQQLETERAFYAGAQALQGILIKAIAPDSVSEEEGEAILDDLGAELRQYYQDVTGDPT